MHVAGLARFLLSKAAAAYSRQLPKDWYDIAYVLMHNDAGGPVAAAERVQRQFAGKADAFRSSLRELQANFANSDAQGTQAFVRQFLVDNPQSDPGRLAADAILAVEEFCCLLFKKSRLNRISLNNRTCLGSACLRLVGVRFDPSRPDARHCCSRIFDNRIGSGSPRAKP